MLVRRLAMAVLAFSLIGGIAFAQDDSDSDKKPDQPPPPDPALTECIVPFKPAVVLDGAKASDKQINDLADRIRRYQNQLTAYRACLQPKMDAAKAAGDQPKYGALVQQYNDSVTAEEEVVGAYQAIVTAHKTAQP